MSDCPGCGRVNAVDARYCSGCGAALARDRDQRRKPATLLFCDVVGSTALAEANDSETVREIMVAYFRAMRGAIEAHGGTVEKFIGDAVVGVFGVPVAHEDDALRGVRAAAEMLERMDALNAELDARHGARLALRIGLNTGEVVTGGIVTGDLSMQDSFVSGDTVNVAARLEQAAGPGTVLLGETTYALVARTVDAEEEPPLSVKGKTLPLKAFRLLGVHRGAAPATGWATPFVGREPELARLRSLLDRVRATRVPARALVLGEPGVGKSRLVSAALEAAGGDVRVLSVRCLPYGEHITYFPLVEVVREAAEIRESDDVETALVRIARLFAGEPNGAGAVAILGQVLGLAGGAASADEIAWAARRLVEILAAERALVLLVDDLQWAEDPFVELLIHIADRGHAPILVLCVARPELSARRPDWPPDVRLHPLSSEDAQSLLLELVNDDSLPAESRSRLLEASGGNPLFLEELVAYLSATGEGADLPPTLDALLNARLDARPAQERRTLECGAVEGEVFHRGAVLVLAPDDGEPAVDEALVGLTGDSVVRVVRAEFENERAFRFHHLLLRDVVYRGTAKRRRADLHLLFARWLEEKLGARIGEVAEIVAYHLEQVCRLREQLGPSNDETRAVGAQAAELLEGAGRRSLARGDAAAALSLFTRAEQLAVDQEARLDIALCRGIAARELGEFPLSESVLGGVEDDAERDDLPVAAARARLELALTQIRFRPAETAARLQQVAEEALETFERWDHAHGLALAYFVLSQAHWQVLHLAEEERLLEQALVHAERRDDDGLTSVIVVSLARAVLFGPRPAGAALPRIEPLLARARRIGPTPAATITMMTAVVEAMRGEAARARELIAASVAVLEESAAPLTLARSLNWAGVAESILGDAEHAETILRRSFDLHAQLGERSVGSTTAALLARVLVDLERLDESEQLSSLALEWCSDLDFATQAYARSARALALAARGALEDARREALAAVELSADSDFANQRGNAFLDLAVVLRACGDDAEARAAAATARSYFVAKENLPAAERASTFRAP